MPTSRRSGCIRRGRPACQKACGTCIPISPRPRTPTRTGTRYSRRRCRAVGGETVFRLWPRQRADVSDVGRRHHRSQLRASDAGLDVRADEQIQSHASSSACRRCSRAMLNDETLKHERAGSRLRICTSAGEALPEIGRQCLEGALRRRYSRRRRLDRVAAYLSVQFARRYQIRHLRDARCRATGCGSSMKPVARWQMARSANCWSMRPRRARAIGISAAKAARLSRGTGPGPATNMFATREGRYTFCGRSDDMFKVSGIWVSPFEVESA